MNEDNTELEVSAGTESSSAVAIVEPEVSMPLQVGDDNVLASTDVQAEAVQETGAPAADLTHTEENESSTIEHPPEPAEAGHVETEHAQGTTQLDGPDLSTEAAQSVAEGKDNGTITQEQVDEGPDAEAGANSATTEEVPSAEAPTEATTTEEVPSAEAPTEAATTEEVPSAEAPTEATTTEEVPSAEAPTEAATADTTPAISEAVTTTENADHTTAPAPDIAVGGVPEFTENDIDALLAEDEPEQEVMTVGQPSVPGLRVAGITDIYDKGVFGPPMDENQLPRECIVTTELLSLETHKRNNLAYIENDVLVTTAGNRIVFIDLKDMSHTYMPGLDGGGIGALAVHPTRKFIAVAEKCRFRNPNVYVYSYPALELIKVMTEGTDRAYSALCFNDKGDMLASVGGFPDYLLTLWNWEQEAIILRSKAFSQDVYTIKFSPYFDGYLNTCGTGHIRFWKMASTFTGLKLQGQIGKFGAVELSDVVAFVEMPDGKVLSSTESGDMLMWDGGLIKVVIMRPNHRPCHEGGVLSLMHDRSTNLILSGGADGYVRLWQFSKINEAEADEDKNSTTISPIDELLIAPGARIKTVIWERKHWIILDESGAIYKVVLSAEDSNTASLVSASLALSKGATVTKVMEFHSGGIVGMHLSPKTHVAVTAGADGTIRAYEYAGPMSGSSRLWQMAKFGSRATCVSSLGNTATLFAIGFKDGTLRLVRRCSDGFVLLAVTKPHRGKVTAISISPNGRHIATTGADGTVFFFTAGSSSFEKGMLVPVAYTVLPAITNCLAWTSDCNYLLCGTAASTVIEVKVPDPASVDVVKTYEVEGLIGRQYKFQVPPPPRKKKVKPPSPPEENIDGNSESGQKPEGTEEEEKEDWEPQEAIPEEALNVEIVTVQLTADGSGDMLLTVGGPLQMTSGYVWRCSFEDMTAGEGGETLPARPFGTACTTSAPTTFFDYSVESGGTELAMMGSADGLVRVQQVSGTVGLKPLDGRAWQTPLHDMQEGRVTGVCLSFDGAFLLSAAMDGTLYVQTMKLEGSPSVPASKTPEGLPSIHDTAPHGSMPNISVTGEYTIEEAKQKAERDALLAAAEAKKMGVREYLNLIRTEFEALLSENAAKPEAERLPKKEHSLRLILG